MKRYFLAAAAVLSLSAGSAFAQGTTTAPANAPTVAASPYYGYYTSGYVFPNDGSPSGDDPTARPVPQAPRGIFSNIYLYPPAQGNDGGGPG